MTYSVSPWGRPRRPPRPWRAWATFTRPPTLSRNLGRQNTPRLPPPPSPPSHAGSSPQIWDDHWNQFSAFLKFKTFINKWRKVCCKDISLKVCRNHRVTWWFASDGNLWRERLLKSREAYARDATGYRYPATPPRSTCGTGEAGRRLRSGNMMTR